MTRSRKPALSAASAHDVSMRVSRHCSCNSPALGCGVPGLRQHMAWAIILAWGGALLLGGCGSVTPPAEHAGRASASLQRQAGAPSDVVMHALSLVGTPYRYGGNTPQTGFDCSGLIRYVYLHSAGRALPRTVEELSRYGRQVAERELRAGDIVIFGQRGKPTHAGIYVGDGRFVHAPSKGGVVRLDQLSSRHWASRTFSYRRP